MSIFPCTPDVLRAYDAETEKIDEETAIHLEELARRAARNIFTTVYRVRRDHFIDYFESRGRDLPYRPSFQDVWAVCKANAVRLYKKGYQHAAAIMEAMLMDAKSQLQRESGNQSEDALYGFQGNGYDPYKDWYGRERYVSRRDPHPERFDYRCYARNEFEEKVAWWLMQFKHVPGKKKPKGYSQEEIRKQLRCRKKDVNETVGILKDRMLHGQGDFSKSGGACIEILKSYLTPGDVERMRQCCDTQTDELAVELFRADKSDFEIALTLNRDTAWIRSRLQVVADRWAETI